MREGVEMRCARCTHGGRGIVMKLQETGLLWCPICGEVRWPYAREAQRASTREEWAGLWHYWLALHPDSGRPLVEVPTGGAPVTSALDERMAKMLFRSRFGFDVGVQRLSLHGELMHAPELDPEPVRAAAPDEED